MGSRHASPIFISDHAPAVVLERLELGSGGDDGQRREKFVQDLVHDHPDVLPMSEIEPAYMPLVSICRELPTAAGFLDNLWLTPAGGIVLGECKLVRNPQARREVLAQALDYARAITGWHYEDLEGAVRKALKDASVSLWDFVSDTSDLSEPQFADAIERRLRTSRFMVLVIGDGIHEGVEALSDYLQLHAGLHAGIALVDLSIWRGVAGGLVVVPRVPMRTVVVERGIVVVAPNGAATVEPPSTARPAASALASGPKTASEPEFYAQLDDRRPGVSAPLRQFLARIEQLGVTPEFRRTLILRWRSDSDVQGSAGCIEASGRVWLGDAWGTANKVGRARLGDRYIEAVARIVQGQVRRYEKGSPEVFGSDGKAVDLAVLLAFADQWAAAVDDLISGLNGEAAALD